MDVFISAYLLLLMLLMLLMVVVTAPLHDPLSPVYYCCSACMQWGDEGCIMHGAPSHITHCPQLCLNCRLPACLHECRVG